MAYVGTPPLPVNNGGTGQITLTNHGVLIGAGTSGVTQLSVGATGTVLAGLTGADPSFTATPTVTSITLGSGSALSNYNANTSFTPTLTGSTTAGTTTYTTQIGRYIRIGDLVWYTIQLVITGATGTGNAIISGLPFATNSSGNSQGIILLDGSGWTWPTGATVLTLSLQTGLTSGVIFGAGSARAISPLQMVNSAATFNITGVYSV